MGTLSSLVPPRVRYIRYIRYKYRFREDRGANLNPETILQRSTAEGVTLALTATGLIRATGDKLAVSRWTPLIRANKPGIVAILQAVNDVEAIDRSVEVFCFTPPGDHANDDEALQERVAIMMESGIDADTALREARWNADRERCWRGFLRNAQHILDASLSQREDLLDQYRKMAIRRYGDVTGDNMADSLRAWIAGRLQ